MWVSLQRVDHHHTVVAGVRKQFGGGKRGAALGIHGVHGGQAWCRPWHPRRPDSVHTAWYSPHSDGPASVPRSGARCLRMHAIASCPSSSSTQVTKNRNTCHPQRYIYDAQALRAFRARRVINVQYPTSFFVIASRISTTSSFLTRQGSMTRMHLLKPRRAVMPMGITELHACHASPSAHVATLGRGLNSRMLPPPAHKGNQACIAEKKSRGLTRVGGSGSGSSPPSTAPPRRWVSRMSRVIVARGGRGRAML